MGRFTQAMLEDPVESGLVALGVAEVVRDAQSRRE